ncbi:MAG: alpha/beta fold hydrolase [Byssovorax sp.]
MRVDLDLVLGVLNGTVGDYLHRTKNGLSTPMELVQKGRPMPLDRPGLAETIVDPKPRVALFVHGLMSTEGVWEHADGSTYGSLLAQDHALTPLYLRYNSGLHVSENGEALDALLGRLVESYPMPIEELVLIGHSMGGLVIRSATHAAAEKGSAWLSIVRRAFYLGTPHLGAPLERFGNALGFVLGAIGNPYTDLIAQILSLRSSGVKDLRYGNLRREDWEGADADALLQNRRHPVPLLPEIRHHLIAATLSNDPTVSMLFGDAMVTVRSATGQARPGDRAAPFSKEHVRVIPGLGHLVLAHHPEVYAQIRAWCAEEMS